MLDHALENDPQNKIALTNKGAALGNMGKHEEALKCFEETLRIDPDDINAQTNKKILLDFLNR